MAETGATGKFGVPTHDWRSKKIVNILAVLVVLKILFSFLIFGRGIDVLRLVRGVKILDKAPAGRTHQEYRCVILVPSS